MKSDKSVSGNSYGPLAEGPFSAVAYAIQITIISVVEAVVAALKVLWPLNCGYSSKHNDISGFYATGITEKEMVRTGNVLSNAKRRKKGGLAKSYRMRNEFMILFLGADTDESRQLYISEHLNKIGTNISEMAPFIYKIKMRTMKEDIIKEIAACHPNILHFAGHGDESGCLLVHTALGGTEKIEPCKMLASLQACCDCLQVVVLAACYSHEKIDEIARYVDVVVCMHGKVTMREVALFSEVFYVALGNGSPVADAFKLGKAQLENNSPDYSNTPQLRVKDGVDPNKMILIPNRHRYNK